MSNQLSYYSLLCICVATRYIYQVLYSYQLLVLVLHIIAHTDNKCLDVNQLTWCVIKFMHEKAQLIHNTPYIYHAKELLHIAYSWQLGVTVTLTLPQGLPMLNCITSALQSFRDF